MLFDRMDVHNCAIALVLALVLTSGFFDITSVVQGETTESENVTVTAEQMSNISLNINSAEIRKEYRSIYCRQARISCGTLEITRICTG